MKSFNIFKQFSLILHHRAFFLSSIPQIFLCNYKIYYFIITLDFDKMLCIMKI